MTLRQAPEITVQARDIKGILVPLDGTLAAESIVQYVAGMAAHMKASLFLVTCALTGLKSGVPERDYLEKVAAPLRKQGLNVTTFLQNGEPGTGIVEASISAGADLIAMTAHTKPDGPEVLGATVHKVLMSRVEPVLVLRTENGRGAGVNWTVPPAVVVGLDGSALATTALPHAEIAARAFRSEIVLVRAVLPADTLTGAAKYYGAVEDFAERYLAGIAEALRQRGFKVSTRTGHRRPGEELLSAADSWPGSMIVLSTRGLTGRPNLLLGSVTEQVIRSSRHPVLAIPASRPRPA
jgi:nucleotide-binding universal stress UspA family protein